MPVVDPGFLRGGRQSQRECQPFIWPNVSENSVEMNKIGPERGARPKFVCVDPLLDAIYVEEYCTSGTVVTAKIVPLCVDTGKSYTC